MNRSFYALLFSQTSTNLGFALYTMVVVLHLYNVTGSTALSATVTLISVLARMMSGIVLPSISDHFRPNHLLIFSQAVQLILLSGLFILFLQKLNTVILITIFIVLAFISFFNGFFSPVKGTIVKVIVPEHARVKANSLLSSVDQTFLFSGWTFGGVLLAFLGKQTTLTITICLITVSIIGLFFIKMNKASSVAAPEGMLSRLTSGWKYLFQHEGLRIIIIMELIETLVGSIWIGAVTLAFAKEALGKGEAWWGYINGGYYLGAILGGVLVFRFSKFMQGRLTILMLTGSTTFGVLTFAYGFVTEAYLALLLVILMGPSFQIRDLAQETMFQNSTDETTLTRILAAKSTLVQLIFIISIVGVGALTDLIGVRPVYILSGSLMIISSLFGFIHLHIRGKGLSLEREGESAS
ncbi:MFS transporter [Cytobacillus depressus]|uniref:MFS transporter n=1 Tax=Cytobacillus depressus TaxID=1602942 RepID=A0A6L3V3X7_9BACI|nr:MFS transporter [Cytobacillus depressus]KAB2332075.1 MFS transporter [Cytobacillus depressus]